MPVREDRLQVFTYPLRLLFHGLVRHVSHAVQGILWISIESGESNSMGAGPLVAISSNVLRIA